MRFFLSSVNSAPSPISGDRPVSFCMLCELLSGNGGRTEMRSPRNQEGCLTFPYPSVSEIVCKLAAWVLGSELLHGVISEKCLLNRVFPFVLYSQVLI